MSEPLDFNRAFELMGDRRPQQIIDLREKIEAETRAGELLYVSTGKLDRDRILLILKMKLELDRLYVKWIQDEL